MTTVTVGMFVPTVLNLIEYIKTTRGLLTPDSTPKRCNTLYFVEQGV